jgi:rubrerythrin
MTDPDAPCLPPLTSVAEFYAQALAIEAEAAERYILLAEQMEVHNNREIALIFRKMAEAENKHREQIAIKAGGVLAAGLPASFSWLRPDGPEVHGFQDVHYLMTPYHALLLARHNEERAVEFFEAIVETTSDPQIKAAAAELAAEERMHVAWVDDWLTQYPPPPPGWDDDPDPPRYFD